jgi:hypothetical protein
LTTEAEIEVIGLQVKEHKRLLTTPEAKRRTWNTFSLGPPKNTCLCQYLDFRYLV